jgi:hypothetical protein
MYIDLKPSSVTQIYIYMMPLHVSVSKRPSSGGTKHIEETIITLVIVHQIESKFYTKIFIKTICC